MTIPFAVERLLLQLLLILLPMIFYQANSSKLHSSRKREVLFGVLCIISMILCMIFPFEVSPGHVIDLRYIPMIIVFLYAGIRVGLASVIITMVYRYIMGGNGFYSFVWVTLILIPFLLLVIKRYDKLSFYKKMFINIMLVTLIIFLIVVFSYLFMVGFSIFDYWEVTLEYWAVYCLGMLVVVYLQEYLIEVDLLKEQVQKSEKMQIIGQLSASIAHEIRNPMTTVKGFLQLFKTSSGISKTERGYLDLSIDELDRANEIIDDYLSLAKANSLHDTNAEVFDLPKELDRICDSIHSFSTLNGVHIQKSKMKDETILIKGNISKFKQALINIIKNAIEASHENDRIYIHLHKKMKSVIIEIEDNGVGMTEEQVNRIGEPFYSTKEKGTGLGMMVTFRIIESMSGKLTVKSRSGKGTCFSIELPRIRKRSKNSSSINMNNNKIDPYI